jgi:hypothetical protein
MPETIRIEGFVGNGPRAVPFVARIRQAIQRLPGIPR